MTTKGRPPWAKAAIVAVHQVNESDSQTDYFNARNNRVVLLAWSKHNRDLFSEMRKAAATFKQTAHLGPGMGIFEVFPVLENDVPSFPAWSGQHSHWHRDKAPGDPFTTREAAEAWIAAAPTLERVQTHAGEIVKASWVIREEKIEHREKYSMGAGYYLMSGTRYATGWKVEKVPCADRLFDLPTPEELTAAPKAPRSTPSGETAEPGAYQVQKAQNERKGFDFWLCTTEGRLDEENFAAELARCKGLGGWYSRKWGSTPGGFAFREEDKAVEFVGGAPAPDDGGSAPRAPENMAARLREIAEGMQSAIDDKLRDRTENTPKQQRQAACARLDGRTLLRAQAGLLALAALHEAGEAIPEGLAGVRTKKAALELAEPKTQSGNGYYDAPFETGGPYKDTEGARAFWALAADSTKKAEAADKERRELQRLQSIGIPGYFPTPKSVAGVMLGFVENTPGSILEPSCGDGALVRAALALFPEAGVVAYEFNLALANYAASSVAGHGRAVVTSSNFLEVEPVPSVDLVLMNPPFENGQDMEHVRNAYKFLKPGGRLVAVMGPGWTFRQDKKAEGFREWLEGIGECGVERWRMLPDGSFKESGTGTAAGVLVLDA